MKTRILFLSIPLLLSTVASNGQQAEKTLVKAFNLQGSKAVLLNVAGQADVKEWNQEQVRIMMTVTLEQGSEQVLKSLVQSGRYNLQSVEENGVFVISAPGLEKQIKMSGGKEIHENISFEVFVPHNVLLSLKDTETEPTTSSF
ncbi:MAG: hypothetical protein H6577_26140 [Lewinellaceae bacterium]|nr:hypothetical protein [Saprospiraceae bacterium]MCB9341620.1 hypothetical protein [Lewinellaceae bacterium]